MQAILTFLGAMLTGILSKIAAGSVWVIAVVTAVFAALWLFGKDLACWILESVLKLVVYILNSTSINFDVFNPGTYIASMPADLTNMLSLIGLPDAIAIIVAAIGIKVLLQLIPFTRLGS